MGYNKTDSSGGLIHWAKSVRDRLHLDQRQGLLRKKEDEKKETKKDKPNMHNN